MGNTSTNIFDLRKDTIGYKLELSMNVMNALSTLGHKEIRQYVYIRIKKRNGLTGPHGKKSYIHFLSMCRKFY